MTTRLFPALLRYWRGRRGLTQLELALEAEVSARHVSFLESGRSRPSEEMVLRLLSVLSVPLRDQNEALRAAGLPARFSEGDSHTAPASVERVIAQMIAQHEPFPMVVLDPELVVLRASEGARRLFGAFLADPHALPDPLDMISLLFDPRLLRDAIVGWESLARATLARLARESLLVGGDARLERLIHRALAHPDVPPAWRHPDFATRDEPALTVRLAREDTRAAFLLAVTTFSTPRQVSVDELRIESLFPLDDATRALCERLAPR
ncbi:MAG: helix-turn-helix transcriptional regulator [Deltaproteobacteria bacterium]|nr:helix-turn-helix transcriptional regulator [Deltaproteobacteria bacterium]